MGCRTRVFENRFGDKKTSIGRGNLSFTTINIVRLAIESAIETGLLYKRKGNKHYTLHIMKIVKKQNAICP